MDELENRADEYWRQRIIGLDAKESVHVPTLMSGFARAECEKLRSALVIAEKYMTNQRAKSNAPFDPEALKIVRRALADTTGGREGGEEHNR